MALRKDTIKELKGLTPVLAVEEGGTGGNTQAAGRKGLGFEDLGFGVATQAVTSPFDWQQADFVIGQTQLVNVTGWLNAPPELKNPAGDVVSINCELSRAANTRWTVRVVSQSMTATARFEQVVIISGAKGSRTFNVVQEYNSDPTTTVPLTNGGTGGKTAADARVNLELNTRAIVGDVNLNLIGPYQEGLWGQSSTTYATLANNYPAVERGVLEVFKGGRNNCTQRYTTDANRVYTRYLSGSWNGTDGPWSDWAEVGGLSSVKILAADANLSDYANFSQNTTYILSGSRTDLPAGINGNCTIMSVRRAGGVIAALSQILFTSVGMYYRVGSPNTATNWTSIVWYSGGDANGWRLIGMEAIRTLGIGVAESPLITSFDWQQADFLVGSLQVAQFSGFKNGPDGLVYNSTTSITIETLQVRSTMTVVKLQPLTQSAGNKSEYTVVIFGEKGSRTYQVTQNFNSDAPVPISSGGTNAKTAADARVNLELNTRIIPEGKNINEIGPLQEGRWAKTSNTASLGTGFPEVNAVGVLDVYAGGSYGCTQVFITRSGIVYNRFLTGNWNGTGPWSNWMHSASEIPFPDVWLPLVDDLRVEAGFAPRDKLTIGDASYDLPTKSAKFVRASTATYINKAGVLTTAAINEPRFERDGLLMEGQSTNNILNSEDPTKWATYSTLTREVIVDGYTKATTLKATVNAATSANHLVVNSNAVAVVVGDMVTLSARVKSTSDKIRFRFTIDSVENGQAFFTNTGVFISASSSIKCTTTASADGYTYITATCTVANAGACSGNIWFNGETNVAIGQSIFVQTVQCEKNPVATSYIPTGASAVTRSAEIVTLDPAGNLPYTLIGDRFDRSAAFEISINSFIPPSALPPTTTINYFDPIRVRNVNYDIFLRIYETILVSYRSGAGPTVAISLPLPRTTYVMLNEGANNRVTTYIDGKTSNFSGSPSSNPEAAPGVLEIVGHSNCVYHIRNFRIWHRLLTEGQARSIC